LNLKKVANSIDYPDSQLISQEEGTVLFRIWVDKNGNYHSHQVVRSDNAAFAHQAGLQIKNLQFEPAQLDGETVSSWVLIPVRFDIFENRSRVMALR
jgi:TonB family protein